MFGRDMACPKRVGEIWHVEWSVPASTGERHFCTNLLLAEVLVLMGKISLMHSHDSMLSVHLAPSTTR